jgi:hypothetical protein
MGFFAKFFKREARPSPVQPERSSQATQSSGAPTSQNPVPKKADQAQPSAEEQLRQIARLKEFFSGGTMTTAEAAPIAVQADHYIISMLPPGEPDNPKVEELMTSILTANGYIKGNATWELRVNAMALDDSFLVFSAMGFEKRTGNKVDKDRTRIHNYGGKWTVSGTDVRGKMLAMFLEK